MGGRRMRRQQQLQQRPPGVVVVNEWCPGCGEFGHTVAICPTQYQGEEWMTQMIDWVYHEREGRERKVRRRQRGNTDLEWEEPERPAPEWEEPERPAPEWEEPERPAPEWEEPERPAPEWEEPERPAPEWEEPERPAPEWEEPERLKATICNLAT
ncbi:UNVERIFIED_CONTAM: hypothetical protein FKN15_002402 [Acipenser sinensis]